MAAAARPQVAHCVSYGLGMLERLLMQITSSLYFRLPLSDACVEAAAAEAVDASLLFYGPTDANLALSRAKWVLCQEMHG